MYCSMCPQYSTEDSNVRCKSTQMTMGVVSFYPQCPTEDGNVPRASTQTTMFAVSSPLPQVPSRRWQCPLTSTQTAMYAVTLTVRMMTIPTEIAHTTMYALPPPAEFPTVDGNVLYITRKICVKSPNHPIELAPLFPRQPAYG
jgi:hypothetical protein